MSVIEKLKEDRQIRVFISSTFRDMQAERDYLVKFIFPQLRKLCESRGVTWGEVDLRWGVTDEQAAEGKVLPICLEEIKRCRPYFIGLLGERYGWIPETLPSDLVEREPWLKEHLNGKTSVTELEILHGVLRNPKMAGHAYFYFRDPKYIEPLGDEEKKKFIAENAQDAEKLSGLKENIRHSGFPVRENYPDPKALGELVLADLTKVINENWPEGSQPDSLDREAMDHEAYAQSRERVYIGRQEYFDRLDTHAIANDTQPLVILGESGSGKSALLANWVARYRQAHPDALVLQHYIGATPYSADWAAMLRRLMGEFKRRLGIQQDIPDQPDALRSAFPNWLYMAAAKGHVVLVLDALNQLEDRDGAPDLVWLPPVLPENLRLIVSTLPGRPLDEIQKRKWPTLKVELLSADERRKLIAEYLAQHAKALNAARVERIAAAPPSANPLYLRVLLDELRLVRTHEELEERIGDYLKAESPYALYEKVIARWEQDYEGDSDLVGDTLSLLWAARHGLTETELLQELGKPNAKGEHEPLPRAMWSPLFLAMSDALISRGGLLTFAHDFLRTAAREAYLPTHDRQKLAHFRVAAYFAKYNLRSNRAMDEMPWQLMQAEQWELLKHLLLNPNFLGFFVFPQSLNGSDRIEIVKSKTHPRDKYYTLLSYWKALQNRFDMGEEMVSMFTKLEAQEIDEGELYIYGNILCWILDIAGRPETIQLLTEKLKQLRNPLIQNATQSRFSKLIDLIREAKLTASLGKSKEAISLYERFLEESQPESDDEGVEELRKSLRNSAINNLALLKAGAGEQYNAEKMLKANVELSDDENSEFAQMSMTNLANHLGNTGNLTEAINLTRRVLDIRMRQFGRNHFTTLNSLHNLGTMLFKSGDLVEAECLLRAAFEGRQASLGGQHLDTIESGISLNSALMKLGRNLESLALFKGITKASLDQHGRQLEHVRKCLEKLIDDTDNYAGDLMDAGKLEAAGPFLLAILKACEQLLGGEHPYTLRSMHNVALLLTKQGQYARAEQLYRQTLEARERVLGANHSATLLSVNNLAALLARRGDYAGALPFYQRALTSYAKHSSKIENQASKAMNCLLNYAFCMEKKGLSREKILDTFEETLQPIGMRFRGDPINSDAKNSGKLCRLIQQLILDPTNGSSLIAHLQQADADLHLELMVWLKSGKDPGVGQNDLHRLDSAKHILSQASSSGPAQQPAQANHNSGCAVSDTAPISTQENQQSPTKPLSAFLSNSELRDSASNAMKRGLWEAAATYFEKLLQQGEPVETVAPDLITALLNAHETVSPPTVTRIETLLAQLDSAGHTVLAAQLRQQHAAKLAPPKKSWWKLGR